MRMTPVSTVRRLVAVGTKGKEAAEARRIRTVNTAVLFAAVTLVAYAAFHLAFGVATLRPLILILVGFSVLFALFIPLNKLVTPAWTASLFAVVGTATAEEGAAGVGQALAQAGAKGAGRVLWWGGLRGGISIALALSLPAGETRDLILAATFAAVLFSVLVQRATLGRLIEKLKRDHAPAVEDAAPAREPTVL